MIPSFMSAGDGLPEKYRKWLDEDVVYIISAEEQREFSRLSADAQRDAFVDRFWKIRDTNRSTQENEFKKEHYARIQYANEHFNDGIPGWKSDRGRIWILHGPPDDIHYEYGGGSLDVDIEKPTQIMTEDSNPDKRRSYRLSFNKPETESWIYRHIEGARNVPTYFQVIFSRTDPTQIYSLSLSLRRFTRADLSYSERLERDHAIRTFLRGHYFGGPFRIVYAGEYKFQDIDDFYQSLFHPQRLPRLDITDFHLGLQDIERSTGEVLMEKLELARKLKESVRSRLFFEELPLSVRIGTLQAASGSTVLPLSLGLADTDLQGHQIVSGDDTLELLVELVGSTGETDASIMDSVRLKGKETAIGPQSVKFLYQTRLVARPGQYRLAVYAALREHRAVATRELEIDLPDYGTGKLQMSDLLLFENIVPKEMYRESHGKHREIPQFIGQTNPVFLKNFVLIPSCDSRFRRGQKLTAFFEVYNPGVLSDGKTAALKVSCRVQREGGPVQEFPERLLDYITDSHGHRTTYGISIPLLGFPVGVYSMEFEVYDPVQEARVKKATSFSVY